ncbi:carboxylesterase [Motiliproteus sp. SC1-56]|uniref:alpha/beta hydrolase n=1 Tax=Motiliproteus sp. SC1-56 TaxID=2799565 RepID=UPI001A8E04E6|nr:alpha/beta hydrolase [Motiliproteus sp. SC1-56]
MSEPNYLETAEGARLAYHLTPGRPPGVIFLTGFMSDMEGAKALHLQDHLARRGNQFLRFDYRGHGASSERFADGTLGDWANDALTVLDQLTQGPQVLVGSSMGGWIMLLTARVRPERVAGLLGIATAADFTRDLPQRYFNAAQRQELATSGQVDLASCYDARPYTITQRFLDEASQHQLLDAPIPFQGPVRLIQGMCDEDVPWQTALSLSDRLQSQDVEVQLVKQGDHRLSEPGDLKRLCRTLDALLDELEESADADQ